MLTIAELTRLPATGTTLWAGASGAPRTLRAAHVCEMDEPWQWLAAGDLLLTTGLYLPGDAAGQNAFVRSLHDAGVRGVSIAIDGGAPPLTTAMKETADRLGLPVLRTEWHVPFSEVSRLVADHAVREAGDGFDRVLAVYEAYRLALSRSADTGELADQVAATLGLPFELVDTETGRRLLSAVRPDPDRANGMRSAFASALRMTSGSIRRVSAAGADYVTVLIGSEPPAALLVPADDPTADLTCLQHLAALFSIEVNRFHRNRRTRNRVAASVLSRLAERSIDVEHARGELADHGAGDPPWRVAAVIPEDAATYLADLDQNGVSHVHLSRADDVLILTSSGGRGQDDVEDVQTVAAKCVSEPFWSLSTFASAAEDVAWTLRSRHVSPVKASAGVGPFLPNSVEQARDLVDSVLGRLLAYDDNHGTDLVLSLETFLLANRSWQVASTQLSVHRQTLKYRLGRVTDLTGRRLDTIDDVVQLHLALKAYRALQASVQEPITSGIQATTQQARSA